jgi:ferric-dicitrate binding protein FerR (iron transport regulator)
METNKEKIRRFTTDRFSFNDYLSVSSYFNKKEYNKDLKNEMEEDWEETESTGSNTERLTLLLDKVHHEINLKQSKKESKVHYIYRIFSRVAAILLIPAIITIALLSYFSINSADKSLAWAEIHSPSGSRTQFQLPDGTRGWLNSGSKIKFPVNFLKNRNVEISGEAWFDVVHIDASGFRVSTPYFDVKVLGTQFNVNAYENELTAGVILEKGKVELIGKDMEMKGQLDPNEQYVYDKKSKTFVKTNIDAQSYTSWKDGLLIFRNQSMAEIAKRLEHQFNAEIILHGDSLKSSVFRATLQDENLSEICRMLATVAPIRYKIYSRKKLPDDTFTKSKVEMWLRDDVKLKK